jgi:hypothetical protein
MESFSLTDGRVGFASSRAENPELALSKEVWAGSSCEELFWSHIGAGEQQINDLKRKANALYDSLQAMPNQRSEEHFAGEAQYWALNKKAGIIEDQVTTWFDTLQKVCDAEISEAEALRTLPEPVDESEPAGLSKRKKAEQEQRQKVIRAMGYRPGSQIYEQLLHRDVAYSEETGRVVFGPLAELTTDPRRIASGRDAAKLVATEPLDTVEAPQEFFDRTADTHGGKSRKHGKNGRHFVGKSGRRVRKK